MTAEKPDVLGPLKAAELFDPLSPVTRAERKLLLGVSLITLALTWGDLLPTKVAALGIEISTSNRHNLILLLALTLLYFVVAFSTYAAADFVRWRLLKSLAQRESSQAVSSVSPLVEQMRTSTLTEGNDEQLSLLSLVSSDVAIARAVLQRSNLRATFDFAVPLLAASVAAVAVLAQLLKFHDPVELLLFAWSASPRALSSVVLLLALLVVLIMRRLRGPRIKMPLRFRLAGKVMKLGKLLPKNPRIQGAVLRLGLRIHTGKKGT